MMEAAAHSLHTIYRSFTDSQKLRKSFEQRGLVDLAEGLKKTETRLTALSRKYIVQHPLYPWLSQYKGFLGIRMAGVIGMLRDPRRFPGQKCTGEAGAHYLPAGTINEGDPCPEELWDEENKGENVACGGLAGAVRPGTGVRSVWHYAGLHTVEGKLARRVRGQQNTWRDELKTCFLMPDGVVDQVIKQRTKKYRDLYDVQKARLLERPDIAKTPLEKGRNGKAHSIARVIVAKAILGDLLMEWKALME